MYLLLFTRLTEKQFLRTDIACGYSSHTLSSSNPLLLHLLSNLQYLLPSCSSSPPSPPLLLLLYLLLPLLLIFRCSQSPHPLTPLINFLSEKFIKLVSWFREPSLLAVKVHLNFKTCVWSVINYFIFSSSLRF